jgi:hypothetical protein
MSNLYIQHLAQQFRHQHDCNAEHLETVPVIERRGGRTVWQGKVEVFKLKGHPKAKKGYAWIHEKAGEAKPVAVLETGPVTSAETAVKTVVAGGK